MLILPHPSTRWKLLATFLLRCCFILNPCVRSLIAGSSPLITEHPLDILVVKGDPATLRCGTMGENVEIVWYKDSEPVKVGNGHRLLLPNGSLFLLKVNSGGTDSDSGTYYCIAKNEYGQVRSQEANVRIAALIGNRATLECSPPKGFPEPVVTWRKDEKDLNIQEEDKYHLHPNGNLIIENIQRSDAGFYQCIAGNMVGERVPSISWKKRNDQMPLGRAYVARDSRGLKIDRVQPEDSGEYMCYAKNSVGSIETSAFLKVNLPPIFTKFPENVNLNPGGVAAFDCEATGQPNPGIFWSKEGDQLFTFFSGLISSDGRIQVTKDGRLLIEDVRSSDQGNYVCAAVNSAGSTLAKASLTIINQASSLFPPPVIQYGHQNQTLMLNDMAILPCQATGRVPVTITWLKNGRPLSQESDVSARYRQLSVGTLQITDLKKNDTAVYTCHAKNEDGEATWTASLIVEEHTNLNTIFHRMPDAAALPSSPGQPKIINVFEDSIEIEWTTPERYGASPIIGYIVQYYSPDFGESWLNVMDVVPSTRLRVRHLKSGHTYAFVVRAENSKGIGLPSPVSEFVTTKMLSYTSSEERFQPLRAYDLDTVRQRLASEQLVKLYEVKAINSTSMLLLWRRQRKEPLVKGYYIKWRGPPLAPDHTWVNVTNPISDSYVINGLKPFTNYEFFIIPYHANIQGMPSNSLDGTTTEAPPNIPPSDVRIRMLNLTSLRISWRPPPVDATNGILKGYLINIQSNQSATEDRNITTNERATSVTLYRLVPDAVYIIRVAARTAAGVGTFYNGEPVIMNEETLLLHMQQLEQGTDAWFKQPWTVLAIGIVLWCVLLLMLGLLWYRCCHQREQHETKACDFIKIRDGSVSVFPSTANNTHPNFWTDDRGGTVDTFSGGGSGVIAGNTMAHHHHSCNGNYTAHHGSHGKLQQPFCPNHFYNHAGCATMQRAHSPHHYHYAAVPEYQDQRYGAHHANSASTLHRHYRQEYYDDPSPYATTTLVVNSTSGVATPQSQKSVSRCTGTFRGSANAGPPLPTNPVPREPPRNFLSNAAVMKSDDRQCGSDCCQFPYDQHHSHASCSALLELSNLNAEKCCINGCFITASNQQHFVQSPSTRTLSNSRNVHNNVQTSQNIALSIRPHPNRHSTTSASKRHSRSSSVNNEGVRSTRNGKVTSSARYGHLTGGARHPSCSFGNYKTESPQTDVSYIQSSDGTNGSAKGNKKDASEKNHCYDHVPIPKQKSEEQFFRVPSNRRNPRKGRSCNHRASRNSLDTKPQRCTLVEHDEQCESDPLMDGGLEADAELSEPSDDYYTRQIGDENLNLEKRRSVPMQATVAPFQHSPTNARPTRQPFMGINASALSHNLNEGPPNNLSPRVAN